MRKLDRVKFEEADSAKSKAVMRFAPWNRTCNGFCKAERRGNAKSGYSQADGSV